MKKYIFTTTLCQYSKEGFAPIVGGDIVGTLDANDSKAALHVAEVYVSEYIADNYDEREIDFGNISLEDITEGGKYTLHGRTVQYIDGFLYVEGAESRNIFFAK